MTFTSFDAQVEATSLLPSALCPLPSSDAQAIAQFELDQYINAQAIAVLCPQEDLLDKAFDELTPSEWEQLKQYQPEIEIDRGSDVFGTLYRVWRGMNLLGTFYQAIDGNWISQPCDTTQRTCGQLMPKRSQPSLHKSIPLLAGRTNAL